MADPKKNQLRKQVSLSHIEQSLKIIPPPPQQAPVTIYPGPKAQHANLSKADLEIADRLEKLRKRDVEPPTEEEMAFRLAQLKGLPPDHYMKPQAISYHPPDNRSNTEKSEDLMMQMMEEVALDSRIPKSEDGIEDRLARLRGATESRPSQHPVGASTLNSTQAPTESPLDCDEVKHLKEAEVDAGVRSAIKDLVTEPEISAALAEASQKTGARLPRRGDSQSTSSDEKMSGTDDDERPANLSQKDNDAAEVDKIVQLYTKKAQEKKKRRKARAKKAVKDPSGASSYSSAESSTSSDLSTSDLVAELTSESERLSDSD